jgi:hypothetical protein
MENLTLNVTQKQIEDALNASLTKALADSYDSPIRKAVEACIKENDGAIKAVVNEIIASAIADPAFKSRIADVVIAQMVKSAIGK